MRFTRNLLGRETVVSRLVDVLFVYILRAWMSKEAECFACWLTALKNPQTGKSLALMHQEPGKTWTVQSIEQFFQLLFENSAEAKQIFGQTIACPIGSIGAELSNHDEVVRHRVDEIFGKIRDYFEQALLRGQDIGEVDS